jgi:hypothetical protein
VGRVGKEGKAMGAKAGNGFHDHEGRRQRQGGAEGSGWRAFPMPVPVPGSGSMTVRRVAAVRVTGGMGIAVGVAMTGGVHVRVAR